MSGSGYTRPDPSKLSLVHGVAGKRSEPTPDPKAPLLPGVSGVTVQAKSNGAGAQPISPEPTQNVVENLTELADAPGDDSPSVEQPQERSNGADLAKRSPALAKYLAGQSAQAKQPFEPQTAKRFLTRTFPDKEPLIEGVLYRRDIISLTARRRHGKTTLQQNIAVAGSERREYLGYVIPKPFRTVSFYLEDDGRELQLKLARMTGGSAPERFHLYTRRDFMEWKIPIQISNENFRKQVLTCCEAARPDLINFDNLGRLIRADYNNPKEIEILMEFTYLLCETFNAAVLIAAHPRKGNRLDGLDNAASLRKGNREKFFEECMGSSHFINSTGSLWGMERDGDETCLCMGSQRFDGFSESLTLINKNESDWFEPVKDGQLNLILTSTKRKRGWNGLPKGDFSYLEAEATITREKIMSSSSFYGFWKELIRHGLVVEVAPKRYRRVGEDVSILGRE